MTTTMGETEELISLDEFLDFDIQCQYYHPPKELCPNEAKYDVTTKCCGMSVFLCQEHLDKVVNQKDVPTIGFGCSHCLFGPFMSADEWLLITPL